MSAQEVVTAHAQRYDEDLTDWLSCACGQWRMNSELIDFLGDPDVQADRQHAVHVLDELRANGFAVVEKPRPSEYGFGDFGEFPKWSRALPVRVSDALDLVAVGFVGDEYYLNPHEAREAAAALLAAADAAESGEPR